VLGSVIAVLAWLLPTRRGKPKILKQAKEGATAIKEHAREELGPHGRRMAARRKELEVVKAIKNEDERLQALADFANRRK